MAFLEDQVFPIHVSQGSVGGPDWPAEIVTLASGREERNTAWSAPLRSYDAKFGVRTPAELYAVLELYLVARGKLDGFRFHDWTDYRSGHPSQVPGHLDQSLGTGNGVQTQFQLTKRYTRGAHQFFRAITKPFGTLSVGVNGVATPAGWSLDTATGLVTFAAPPANGAVLTWGGQFHVPVRFDTRLDIVARSAAIGDIPAIMLKELRL
tara:strand:+ start:165 stop:788 length:624 start_codon:yes stop_codon:yes gene_type:complete